MTNNFSDWNRVYSLQPHFKLSALFNMIYRCEESALYRYSSRYQKTTSRKVAVSLAIKNWLLGKTGKTLLIAGQAKIRVGQEDKVVRKCMADQKKSGLQRRRKNCCATVTETWKPPQHNGNGRNSTPTPTAEEVVESIGHTHTPKHTHTHTHTWRQHVL